MHIVVVLFDLIFNGADFQSDACPFSLIEFDELFNGRIVIVRSQCHMREVVKAVHVQPYNGIPFSFCASYQGHEMRVSILHQPRTSGLNVMQRMTSEAELWKPVLHQPVVDF